MTELAETVETVDPAESVVSLDIDAAPADVWDALTTDSGLAEWMGEGAAIGNEPGDDLFVPDIVTGEPKRGVLDEVTPEHRIGYTWWPETRPDHATRVAITLTPHRGGTRVTVVESLPATSPIAMVVESSHATAPRAMASMSADWRWRTAVVSVSAARVPTAYC